MSGFGPYDLLQLLTINSKQINVEYRDSIINVILQKTMMGPSTVTVQLMDPQRKLIQNIINQGSSIEIGKTAKHPGQRFILVQYVKAGDQLQLVFESEAVYRLRNQRKFIKATVGTNVTPFVASMVNALNTGKKGEARINFVAPDYATIWNKLTTGLTHKNIVKVNLGRGTTTDPNEDSWTAMSRIASSIGWRLWEDSNTIYFGPDEWWAGTATPFHQPYINYSKTPLVKGKHPAKAELKHIKEFTQHIQLIDFDWDVGKPFGQATATGMMDGWDYQIGEIVKIDNLGPASGQGSGANGGYWMVTAMQRELFNVQASMTLSVPMPFANVFEPTSLPLASFPLKPVGV
jgi:hypothetical protein